jgi:epoxyqueuosine reductase
MKAEIRRKALELGFNTCHFTDAEPPASATALEAWLRAGMHGTMSYLERNASKRSNPQQVLPGARSLVVLTTSYSPPSESAATSHPAAGVVGKVARYARNNDYHDTLAEPLRQLATFIDTTLSPGSRSLWYVDTGPILERDIAQRAGAGFIGKHTNVISRSLGNWLLLSEIITTAEIPPDESEKNRCGTCTRCLKACPTGAIVAPFKLDARLCISYLTIELKGSVPIELRPKIGSRIFGCDDCLEACPWNRFAQTGRQLQARPDLGTMELLPLLRLTDAEFKTRFAGTPMLRSKRRGFLRNVCIALGNVGGSEALPDLETAARDPEPLIAEHALWAIQQIKAREGITPRA